MVATPYQTIVQTYDSKVYCRRGETHVWDSCVSTPHNESTSHTLSAFFDDIPWSLHLDIPLSLHQTHESHTKDPYIHRLLPDIQNPPQKTHRPRPMIPTCIFEMAMCIFITPSYCLIIGQGVLEIWKSERETVRITWSYRHMILCVWHDLSYDSVRITRVFCSTLPNHVSAYYVIVQTFDSVRMTWSLIWCVEDGVVAFNDVWDADRSATHCNTLQQIGHPHTVTHRSVTHAIHCNT